MSRPNWQTEGGKTVHLDRLQDPGGRGLPLSGEEMAIDAKECLARQETTAREICQQLKKEHAVRAKTAAKSEAHKFNLGGSSCMVKNEGKGREMTGFQRHQKIVVLMDILKPSQTSPAE